MVFFIYHRKAIQDEGSLIPEPLPDDEGFSAASFDTLEDALEWSKQQDEEIADDCDSQLMILGFDDDNKIKVICYPDLNETINL